MKYITTFENNIPSPTSQFAYFSSPLVAPFLCAKVVRPIEISSSTSWLACQKNRYGVIVVPKTATSMDRKVLSKRNVGINVPLSTAPKLGRAKNADKIYAIKDNASHLKILAISRYERQILSTRIMMVIGMIIAVTGMGTNRLIAAAIAPMSTPASVSYTHLRAHETRHDLVCRLLL